MAEIVAGRAPIEPETALQLERTLSVSASLLVRLQAIHQLGITREADAQSLSDSYCSISRFPLKELKQLKHLYETDDKASLAESLFHFFGVGSMVALERKVADLLGFRGEPSNQPGLTIMQSNSQPLLAAWLRIGELRGNYTNTENYDRKRFIHALKRTRCLLRDARDKPPPIVASDYAKAGIVISFEPGLSGMQECSATRWLSPKKALIQHCSEPGLEWSSWVRFFRDAAHLILHSRKRVFIDVLGDTEKPRGNPSAEAEDWAVRFLHG